LTFHSCSALQTLRIPSLGAPQPYPKAEQDVATPLMCSRDPGMASSQKKCPFPVRRNKGPKGHLSKGPADPRPSSKTGISHTWRLRGLDWPSARGLMQRRANHKPASSQPAVHQISGTASLTRALMRGCRVLSSPPTTTLLFD
jgi:hypothetical protein